MSTFVIAEAGVNHNGSAERAIELVNQAAASGADAVKFQTFKANELVLPGTDTAEYQKQQTGSTDQYEMLQALELSQETHLQLVSRCEELGIEFISTAFDFSSVDMLVELGVGRLKIPSGELTNLPYLDYVARTGLPMIMSTGMGDLDEVRDAIDCIQARLTELGVDDVEANLTVLHCTSNYPTPLESVNLRAMCTMADEFGLPVGYSDHTAGILVPPVAVAMGASVIEKHFTLDRDLPGPDHKASLEPSELATMIENVRLVELSLGDGEKKPTRAELEVREKVRRSIVARRGISPGQIITMEDLALLRPAGGIPPKDLKEVLGRTVVSEIQAGDHVRWSDLAD